MSRHMEFIVFCWIQVTLLKHHVLYIKTQNSALLGSSFLSSWERKKTQIYLLSDDQDVLDFHQDSR